MRTVKRPRRYVAPRWLAIGRPLLRYSEPRDAYVLRLVGRKWGPVLKNDRRHGGPLRGAAERRGSHARVA
ncbi:MAG: hypothetical protein QOK19_483 [Solirubrobacteraceae bacterium]|jgi:hypothetical protein|nr:hypothetical protein [Solirubrobacterales bacterium]MEA2214922.1 hypothetical protein [Solirubrobacteraceae bacterium]